MCDTSHLRAWVEVDYAAIRSNALAIRGLAEGRHIMAVLKANACQQAAVRVADAISDVCNSYAMATLDEAIELRRAGVADPILVLGYVPPPRYIEVVQNNIDVTVYSVDVAGHLSGFAVEKNATIGIHIKVDTGMGRLGFGCGQEDIGQIVRACTMPNLRLEGVFSHLATADDLDTDFAYRQQNDFCCVIDQLATRGITFPLRHLHNSAGTVALEIDERLNAVRPGLALFGLHPSGIPLPAQFTPAMAFRCRVVSVKTIHACATVGYNRTFTAIRPTIVATLSAGYADGVPIGLSGKGSVIINGQLASVIGRVCMDMFMVDVTDISPIVPGDVATIFGRDGQLVLHPGQVAAVAGTICHDLLTGISSRAERININCDSTCLKL